MELLDGSRDKQTELPTYRIWRSWDLEGELTFVAEQVELPGRIPILDGSY